MELTTIDRVARSLSRLIFDLQGKVNVEKLLNIFSDQEQEIEDVAIELSNQKNIDIAVGDWLDFIGKILGITRDGFSDKIYRELLKAGIGASNSNGTPNNILRVLGNFTNSDQTRIIEYPFANFFIIVGGEENLTGRLHTLAQDIKPAGVFNQVISNVGFNRFSPAWIIQPIDPGAGIPFNLDIGDTLLLEGFELGKKPFQLNRIPEGLSDFTLSSGETYDVITPVLKLDQLNILEEVPSSTTYYRETSKSTFFWMTTDPLQVIIGTQPPEDFILSIGGTLDLVSSTTPLTNNVGKLPEVITLETEASQ